MKLHFVLPLLFALSACNSNTTPAATTPPPQLIAATTNASETRAISFAARMDETLVVANCVVKGPSVNVSFATPAVVSLPVVNDRASVTSIDCSYDGVHKKTDVIPGTETRTVLVDFSSPRHEFWFKRANGSVLYYARPDVLVTVRGSLKP